MLEEWQSKRPMRMSTDQRTGLTGDAWQETGYVFTISIDTPIELRNATRAFKVVLSAASSLQSGCLTYGTRAQRCSLRRAVSPRVVMETPGHSQVSGRDISRPPRDHRCWTGRPTRLRRVPSSSWPSRRSNRAWFRSSAATPCDWSVRTRAPPVRRCNPPVAPPCNL